MNKKPHPVTEPRLSSETLALLQKTFWCDFTDIIPALTWDDTDGNA